MKRRKETMCEFSVESSKLTRFLQSLPCAGISKLILTGLSIILTVLVSNDGDLQLGTEDNLDPLVFVTIYLSFALSGILDILCFYSYPR